MRLVPREAKGDGSPVTEVTESSELPRVYWESNWGTLEEKAVLLTTEPSLQPLCFPFTLHNIGREGNYVTMEIITRKKLEFQDLKNFWVAKN